MTKTILTEKQAQEIWKILVEECGATESEQDNFVSVMSCDGSTEYRFCGHLGSGGKVHFGDRVTVSCYKEDESKNVLGMIEVANECLLLMELQERKSEIDFYRQKIKIYDREVQQGIHAIRKICPHPEYTKWEPGLGNMIHDWYETSQCVYCESSRTRSGGINPDGSTWRDGDFSDKEN